MKVPKTVRTYCPRCRRHTDHKISLYKRGKEGAMKLGVRKHEKEKKGYGGQKYPEQKRKAKTTKKQTLKYACKECGYTYHKRGLRLRKLTIER